MEVEHRLHLLPKQLEFVHAQEREVLFSGAYGASKSVAVCMKLVLHAQVPGNRCGLIRKTLASLKKSTLVTLLEGDSCLPPVLPRRFPNGDQVYDFKQSTGTIQVNGGGRIELSGLDNAEKLRSMAFGCCAVDEVTELTEYEWAMINGRCRLPVYEGTGLTNQIFGATNPGAPTHWAYPYFFGPNAASLDRRAISTRSSDNPFLPDSYVTWLKSLTGQQRDRYVEGKWVSFSGAFYDNFVRDLHLVKRELPWPYIYAGVDNGCVHPAVILVVAFDSDWRAHVLHEWYERGHTEAEIADAAHRIRAEWAVDHFYVDPSAAQLRLEFERRGLPCQETDNDRAMTSRLIYDRLKLDATGRPRLTIDPDEVRMLPLELESIPPHPGKNEPKKQASNPKGEPAKGGFDDAHDALRYCLAGVDRYVLHGTEFADVSAFADPDAYDLDEDAEAWSLPR